MAEIFISYARPNRDYARRLADYLEDAGLSVWWDISLKPGEVFREEIERRIGEARHAIVLWSETSVKSHFVLDEAGEAASQDKLVPVRIDGCKLPLEFGQHHTHTVSDWPGDLAPVLAAVGGSNPVPNPIPAPAKAAEDFFNMHLDDANAYIGRAIAYAKKDDADKAIADCNEAIRLNPNFAYAHALRGELHSSKGDHDHAIADYNQAIRLKADYADAYNNRGVAYCYKRDYARAISDFDQVLQIEPDHKSAAANKALAEKELVKARKK